MSILTNKKEISTKPTNTKNKIKKEFVTVKTGCFVFDGKRYPADIIELVDINKEL